MYLYRDLKIELDDEFDTIISKLSKKLKVNKNSIKFINYYKISIDARDKEHIYFIASILFDSSIKISNKQVSIVNKEDIYPVIRKDNIRIDYKPIVVGFGPSGMFAALNLARKGLKPIVIEQGKDVDNRIEDVNEFLEKNILNTKSNVVFGEGGAGTFSDGKLNTSNKDPYIRLIINEFVSHGAPTDILYLSKPHIGTDKLIEVVKNIREEIISLGGEVLFNTTFKSIKTKDEEIESIVCEKDNEEIVFNTKTVFLCIGHSSFDTYKYLYDSGIELRKKPFAIGLRIQHKQEFINKAQYGKYYNHPKLPAASYKLITHLDNGRTVFSFCNCPGGEVINSSSEEDRIVCNGMSNYARNGLYCNSAILVNVTTDDIKSDNPLDGISFQKSVEEKCFSLNKSHLLTCQKCTDFYKEISTSDDVKFDMKSQYKFGKLNGVLPDFIEESIKMGLKNFDKIIKGFLSEEAYLFGVETRSSSPITIVRNERMESVSLKGLYPCGEGAGQAGGITTSAIDGYKASNEFIKSIGGKE